MADLGPNQRIARQKLIMQRATMAANLERNNLQLLQIDEQKKQIEVNKKSLEQAIEECEQKLAAPDEE